MCAFQFKGHILITITLINNNNNHNIIIVNVKQCKHREDRDTGCWDRDPFIGDAAESNGGKKKYKNKNGIFRYQGKISTDNTENTESILIIQNQYC